MSAKEPRKSGGTPGSGRAGSDRTGGGRAPNPPNIADSPRRADEITELVGELRRLFDEDGPRGALTPGAAEVQRELLRVAEEYRELSLLGGAALKNVPIGSPGAGLRGPATMAEAATHAVEMVRRDIESAGIALTTSLSREAADASCGPLYAVLLQGLRNAAEAVRRAGESGRIVLRARFDKGALLVEIEDDGVGPPRQSEEMAGGAKRGMGLSICGTIVDRLGGSMELVRGRGAEARPGAVLRIHCPGWPLPATEDKAAA